MRGGTSKGVFFNLADLPADAVQRDAILLRVIGSPDPYCKHSDGIGGATSSTSKVVLLSKSQHAGCDVDYLFGAVALDAPLIDWSGNCGNLSAAVGPAALHLGLLAACEGVTVVNIWQANIGQRIVAEVPVIDGMPDETGSFQEDGVAFAGAEIRLSFIEEGSDTAPLLPTGNIIDVLQVPGFGPIEATLLTAGNPTVFIEAAALGLSGAELPDAINANSALLARCEAIRAHAAVLMGLAPDTVTATRERPATPKLSWIAPPGSYRTSAGVTLAGREIDVLARILSMGKLHHAYTGTGAIALAAAAALPGSIVAKNRGLPCSDPVAQQTPARTIRIGHASGCLLVGATVSRHDNAWKMERAILSRSARIIMSGWVHLP